jgi:peptidoglycan/xylan/chitin deacetylase (PgdA/CDA1 family)
MQFAPVYPLLHNVLKPLFPNCLWTGNIETPAIALTFDDGPHPTYTPQLLKVLERYQVPASFFWLGEWVKHTPATAKAVYEQGHWIGMHGYTHRLFPQLSPTALQQALDQTRAEIVQACGMSAMAIRDVRPPYGVATTQTLKLLHQWNYRPVMWSVVPEDWMTPGVKVVGQRVLRQVKNGSLIALHDGVCGGEDIAETIEWLIPRLLERGYHFATVDKFWQACASKPCEGINKL